MEKRRHGMWHIAREFVTHWSVAGAILAATGAAPEHWFAELIDEAHLPRESLPWLGHIDYRLLALIAGLSIIVGDTLWRHHRRHPPSAAEGILPFPAPEARAEVLPLPDRPSIAVLAFDNLSDIPEQEYFSDGVADDIITELSRNRSLFVIARNSSFTYKGRAVDVKQVGRELGVRYVVEGSVRRDGNRIRITAQLIDAETGSHVWAERFDRDLANIFTIQDEITRAMVMAIDPAIAQAERRRALRKPPETLSAWEAYQRALSRWLTRDRSESRNLLQRAVALDPRFAPARALLARLTLVEGLFDGDLPWIESVKVAEAQARMAIELDPDLATAHAALAWVLECQGDLGSSLEESEAAISLNPNEPWGFMDKGSTLLFVGRYYDAAEPLAIALRLDPRGPTAPVVMHHRAIGSYFGRDYAAAASTARQGIRTWPEYPRTYPVLAAALGQLDQVDDARAALEAAITASKSHFKIITSSRPPWLCPEDHEHLLDGLRKAGWEG